MSDRSRATSAVRDAAIEARSDLASCDLVVERAAILASWWHRGQRYGCDPYFDHCKQVHDVLVDHGWECNEPLLAAAYLHDTIEDCWEQGVTRDVIDSFFPAEPMVGILVQAVTNEEGRNRRQRLLRTFLRIHEAGPRAIALKLADRIVNVRACWRGNDGRLFMYRDEHDLFRDLLHTRPVGTGRGRHDHRLVSMWKRLDVMLGLHKAKGTHDVTWWKKT